MEYGDDDSHLVNITPIILFNVKYLVLIIEVSQQGGLWECGNDRSELSRVTAWSVKSIRGKNPVNLFCS